MKKNGKMAELKLMFPSDWQVENQAFINSWIHITERIILKEWSPARVVPEEGHEHD